MFYDLVHDRIVELIPRSRRLQSYFLWPVLGITHKYGFCQIIISYGTGHRISDHSANLITSFSFVKVWIAALGLCAKVIASVARCNTVSLIHRRLWTIKFRFIECWEHNKHSPEAIPESEGLLFFSRDLYWPKYREISIIILYGGYYNVGSQRSGNDSFSNPNPVNCFKRALLQLTD